MTEINQTIIDSTKPNAGRVYDYLLGGDYNFDVDRQAAEAVKKMYPNIVKIAKLIRWFLGVGIRKSIEWGFTQFIDFASGLPTVDHIHRVAPKGTTIIYSDLDPITVQIGKDIIKNEPRIRFEACDAAKPEILLESEAVKTLVDKKCKVAVGFNGVCYFLTDEQLSHAMKTLYDWVAEGSILFLLDYDGGEQTSEDAQELRKSYKNMQQPVFIRESKEIFLELTKPWKVKEPGFLKLEEWLGWEPDVTNEEIKRWGGGGILGGFLYK